MLIDANLLVFAVHEESPFHVKARDWLNDQLNGKRRIGIPWQSLGAFLRIVTNQRIVERALDPSAAWQRIEDWLAEDLVWTPDPTPRHANVLGDLVKRHQPRGNLITDAQLGARSRSSMASKSARPIPTSHASPRSAGATRSLLDGEETST